ncbi:MerR family transcriptional regulator [Streptomyces sp. R21]|uniref:MerR family transcriptional regulator n=1 Tax=Streptomyces sp. R21 TaxID=3238627 RepID=A0AB39PKQ1_9ACTN
MDDGDTLCTIGELARRTGLSVKAIRFYSDRGIVPPTDRTAAGYRRYGADAVARLKLVRTLRDLGLGLPTVRQVVDRKLTLAEVAAEHAAALDVQIRALRLRRTVLTVAARRGSTPEETDFMHQLATLSEGERRRLIDEFLDAVFGGADGSSPGSAFAAVRRTMTPELPESADDDQLAAWVELAELSADPDFRTAVRRLVEDYAADRAADAHPGPHPRPGLIAIARDHAEAALASRIAPDSPLAAPVVNALTAHCAHTVGMPDDAALRQRLLTRLETANDPRRDRYFALLARINGWPPPEDLAPALDWTTQALRAQASR